MPDILQVDIFATFEMYDVMPSLRGKAVAAKTLSGYVFCHLSEESIDKTCCQNFIPHS